MIIAKCPGCEKRLSIQDRLSGKQGACPACGQVFRVPAANCAQEKVAAGVVATATTLRHASPAQSSLLVPQADYHDRVKTPCDAHDVPQGLTRGSDSNATTLGSTDAAAAVPAAQSASPSVPGDIAAPLRIWQYRHEKEKVRFILAAGFGGLVWLVLLPVLVLYLLFAWPALLGGAVMFWLAGAMYRTRLLGNAVKVSSRQHPEIWRAAHAIAGRLGLSRVPGIFVVNSEGAVNALAIRLLRGRLVILNSALVDLLMRDDRCDELEVILAHELAHHAAGHLSWRRRLLLKPAMLLPLVGPAYARACELTADRLAAAATGTQEAAERALAALAGGSSALVRRIDLDAFMAQEEEVNAFLGFIGQIFMSHPRLTRRVCELRCFAANRAMHGDVSSGVAA